MILNYDSKSILQIFKNERRPTEEPLSTGWRSQHPSAFPSTRAKCSQVCCIGPGGRTGLETRELGSERGTGCFGAAVPFLELFRGQSGDFTNGAAVGDTSAVTRHRGLAQQPALALREGFSEAWQSVKAAGWKNMHCNQVVFRGIFISDQNSKLS